MDVVPEIVPTFLRSSAACLSNTLIGRTARGNERLLTCAAIIVNGLSTSIVAVAIICCVGVDTDTRRLEVNRLAEIVDNVSEPCDTVHTLCQCNDTRVRTIRSVGLRLKIHTKEKCTALLSCM